MRGVLTDAVLGDAGCAAAGPPQVTPTDLLQGLGDEVAHLLRARMTASAQPADSNHARQRSPVDDEWTFQTGACSAASRRRRS